MFTEEMPTFSGRYYEIAEAINEPRPVRPDGIPILIGGGGEQRTLRLVAQYGDACNLFGDVGTIRHKLDVLNRHCETVGRDPATITKTRLGGLVIAETSAEAATKAADMAAARGMDAEHFRGYVVAGNPDAVTAQVAEFLEAGLDGLIFNMPDAGDLESVQLAGKTLTTAFG
jgi:alkanesulfonate monooxygenase SsuD/methylene tetrahydromethanopterin reductase-like flavin-dependent oxidoreductase (luciferase family)